jgi:uroporphyrinogen-III synthase
MTIRVVVTTSAGSLPGLEDHLSPALLACIRQPLLDFETTAGAAALVEAVRDAPSCDAIACTSPRAAGWLAGATTDAVVVPPVWVTGARTAEPLAGRRVRVRIVAVESAAGAAGVQLAEAMLVDGVRGPVLHVTGVPHRPELATCLADRGVPVVELPVYRSRPVGPAALASAVDGADLVVIGSPALAAALAGVPRGRVPGYVALGRTTANACVAAGLEATATARTTAPDDVAEAILHAARTRALPVEG